MAARPSVCSCRKAGGEAQSSALGARRQGVSPAFRGAARSDGDHASEYVHRIYHVLYVCTRNAPERWCEIDVIIVSSPRMSSPELRGSDASQGHSADLWHGKRSRQSRGPVPNRHSLLFCFRAESPPTKMCCGLVPKSRGGNNSNKRQRSSC